MRVSGLESVLHVNIALGHLLFSFFCRIQSTGLNEASLDPFPAEESLCVDVCDLTRLLETVPLILVLLHLLSFFIYWLTFQKRELDVELDCARKDSSLRATR